MNNPDITQKQKREVMENDRLVRQRSTYFHHAQSIDLEMGGRYSKLTPTSVSGSTPGPIYPGQPSTAPSNQMAMMPEEPPLGYSVNDQEPTGEKFEVAASLGSPSTAMADVEGTSGGLDTSGPKRIRRRL
jgi:hypothetical protein